MFFRKKRKMRLAEDQRLIETIEEIKEQLSRQKSIVESSVDLPDSVLNEFRLAEAKYLFLLKEARVRNTTKGSPK